MNAQQMQQLRMQQARSPHKSPGGRSNRPGPVQMKGNRVGYSTQASPLASFPFLFFFLVLTQVAEEGGRRFMFMLVGVAFLGHV